MNDKSPFFSIVMPAFNVGEYISEAIESVLKQTFKDWELIIVDDLSRDNTYDIAKSYEKSDARIFVFQMNENSGSAYQPRKKAIAESSGYYIVSLDADDTIEVEYLNKMYDRIKDTNSPIIYGKMVCGCKSLPVETFDISRTYTGRDAVRYTLNGWLIGANGAAVIKQLYNEVFLKYKTEGRDMNADEILTRQLLIEADTLSFSEAHYYYRINNESITKRVGLHRFSALKSALELRNLIESNYGDNDIELQLVEQQLLNVLSSSLKLYYQNYSFFKDKEKRIHLNKSFQEFYDKINWNLIKCISPLKQHLFKRNLRYLKLWIVLRLIYSERIQRRK